MKIDVPMLAVVLALWSSASFAQTASPAASAHDTQTVAATPIPSTAGDAEDSTTSDPETAAADAAQHAWEAYQDTIADALIDSDRPRDWMLAANMMRFVGDASAKPPQPSRAELLERAARRAPDDVLVQWMATLDRSGGNTCVAKPVPDENVEALTRLEPDNAASWMMALALASARKNPALVDDALAHMASSARYDDHFADTLHAWIDVYDRFPMPDSILATEFLAPTPQTPRTTSQSMLSSTSALAQAAAIAMPAYHTLITACKPGTGDGDSWQRHAYCEDAGRLMLGKGKTLIARSIGFAVLRNLGRFTAADQQERRNLDWYMHAGIELFGDDGRDADALAAYQVDWRNLDDEIEVIRRALRRAGLPDEAPAGWAGSSWSVQKMPQS
ncbi:hypothetical protein GCM10009105_12140 [Dokdonella soli]|uniref:Uncharacterized protein n=2 Tax=Dokdonella soli TaxID=529810 RepID=A0ABN1IEF5_9GAMM